MKFLLSDFLYFWRIVQDGSELKAIGIENENQIENSKFIQKSAMWDGGGT